MATEVRHRPQRAVNGEVTVPAGRPMKYAHGEYAAYVVDRCRCPDCTAANTRYEQTRAASPLPAYVDADPAREHLAWLATQGVGLKQVARRSGVSHGAISNLVYGKHGRAPSKRCRPDTLARILAVSIDDRAGGARADPETTLALLDEMLTAGATRSQIARLLGSNTPELQLGATVKMSTAHQVADIYRRWKTGELQLGHRDRWGNFYPAVPDEGMPKRLIPAVVPVDMRHHRHKKVVAAARTPIPAPQAEVVCTICTGPHPATVCPTTRPAPTRRAPRAGWQQRARCAGKPIWLFFPTDTDHVTIGKAKAVCAACPVRDDCAIAHADEPAGIFGGLTPDERMSLAA